MCPSRTEKEPPVVAFPSGGSALLCTARPLSIAFEVERKLKRDVRFHSLEKKSFGTQKIIAGGRNPFRNFVIRMTL